MRTLLELWAGFTVLGVGLVAFAGLSWLMTKYVVRPLEFGVSFRDDPADYFLGGVLVVIVGVAGTVLVCAALVAGGSIVRAVLG
jgi:hypothetical protein